ncbi:hypothetical protein V5O48_018750, partial [Marasmius crinis-equi]
SFFTNGIGYKYNFIQPVTLFRDTHTGQDLPEPLPPHIQPLYYSAIIAAEAIGNSGSTQIVEVAVDETGVAGYAFYENGKLARALFIDSEVFLSTSSDSPRSSVHLDLDFDSEGITSFTAKRLAIRHADDLSGLTWGGQTYETADGRVTGELVTENGSVADGLDGFGHGQCSRYFTLLLTRLPGLEYYRYPTVYTHLLRILNSRGFYEAAMSSESPVSLAFQCWKLPAGKSSHRHAAGIRDKNRRMTTPVVMAADSHGISAYLKSNNVPSFHDASAIRGIISEKLFTISRIEQEILAAEETLKKLNQKKDEAQKDLQLHRSLLCGVRRLPLEILGEIFTLCTNEGRSILTPPHSLKAPMLFCQVSKSWRMAAISNPLLWCTFGIDVSCRPHSTELTNLWLKRSQNMPLTLGLRVNGEGQDHDRIRTLTIALVRDCLNPQFNRCRSFTFRCTDEFDDQLLEEIPLLDTPNIQHLDLPLDLPNCPFMFQWCFHLAISSSHLRQLTCGIPSVLTRACLWDHIEKLDLRFMGLGHSQVEGFLNAAPRLKELNFGLVTRGSQPASTTTPLPIIQHDSLRALKIYDRSENLGAFLDVLKLPNLLALTIAGRRRAWPHGQMLGFLERSGCPLQLLNVESTMLTPEELITYLSMKRIRQSLEDLRVNKTVPTSKTLLEFLTVKPSSKKPIPLPSLRSFLCSIDPVNQSTLYEQFVRSRWNEGSDSEPLVVGAGEDSVQVARLRRIYLTIISPIFEGATIETPDLNALLKLMGKDSDVVVTVYRLSNTFDDGSSPLPPEPPSPPASEYGSDDED